MTQEGAEPAAAKSEERLLVARAGVVGLGTLFSRVLGLFRDIVLAAIFPKAVTDAFFVAFTIPNALRQLLGEGAVSSAVVPVLSGKLANEGEEAAREFFRKIRGVSWLLLTIVSILGVVFARPLTALFASGHEGEVFERTALITRLVFPYVFFVGSTALGMAALQANRKFAVAAFAPSLLNVGFIASALLLPPTLRLHGIDVGVALAVGALVGGVAQMAAQAPALAKIGYAAMPKIDFRDPGVREVGRRLLPMTVGIGIYYIDLILSRRFLSELGEGSQSFFTWAQRICDFPQGIFVMALSSAALPSLSALAAKKDHAEFGKTFSLGLRLSLVVAIPASVFLAFFALPVVVLFFQRGAFDAESSRQTAMALAWQGGGIVAVALVRQLASGFYALGDTKTTVVVSILDLVVFIVLAITLRDRLGHVGISIAVCGSSVAQALMLLVAFTRKKSGTPWAEVASSFARILIASVAAAFAARAALHYLFRSPTALAGIVATLAFGLGFLLFARVFRVRETEMLSNALVKKIRRR